MISNKFWHNFNKSPSLAGVLKLRVSALTFTVVLIVASFEESGMQPAVAQSVQANHLHRIIVRNGLTTRQCAAAIRRSIAYVDFDIALLTDTNRKITDRVTKDGNWNSAANLLLSGSTGILSPSFQYPKSGISVRVPNDVSIVGSSGSAVVTLMGLAYSNSKPTWLLGRESSPPGSLLQIMPPGGGPPVTVGPIARTVLDFMRECPLGYEPYIGERIVHMAAKLAYRWRGDPGGGFKRFLNFERIRNTALAPIVATGDFERFIQRERRSPRPTAGTDPIGLQILEHTTVEQFLTSYWQSLPGDRKRCSNRTVDVAARVREYCAGLSGQVFCT